MNCRTIILLFAILFCINQTNCMQNAEYNQSKFCPLLKKIKPDDPEKKYDELAALLKQNKLTTCACMKYFMDIKEKKALKGIKEQWHQTDETLNTAFTKAYILEQNQDKSTNDVEIDNRIPLPVQQKILQKFNNIKGIEYDSNPHAFAAAIARFDARKYQTTDAFELQKFIGYLLNIGPNFFKLSETAQDGILIHERSHIDHKDVVAKIALQYTTQNQLPAFGFNVIDWNKKTPFLQSVSFNKYERFTESRADRIPAACINSNTALLLENAFLEIYIIMRKQGTIPGNNHPSALKRFAWATRIRKLMTAEEKLNKQESRVS